MDDGAQDHFVTLSLCHFVALSLCRFVALSGIIESRCHLDLDSETLTNLIEVHMRSSHLEGLGIPAVVAVTMVVLAVHWIPTW